MSSGRELTDALALCLVLLDEDPVRYERSAVRWLARLALDRPPLGLDELLIAACSLAALRTGERAAPVAALSALLKRVDRGRCVQALAAWSREA